MYVLINILDLSELEYIFYTQINTIYLTSTIKVEILDHIALKFLQKFESILIALLIVIV